MPERSLLLTGATGFVGGAVQSVPRARGMARAVPDARRWRGPKSANPRSTGCRATWRIRRRAPARSRAVRPRSISCTGSVRAGTTTSARSTRPRPSPRRRRRGRGTHRLPRRRRPDGCGLRAPAQPARRGRDAARRPGARPRAAREHDRRARQHELAHRARSGRAFAAHGAALVAPLAHAAGRHRRRRRRAPGRRRTPRGEERLVRSPGPISSRGGRSSKRPRRT